MQHPNTRARTYHARYDFACERRKAHAAGDLPSEPGDKQEQRRPQDRPHAPVCGFAAAARSAAALVRRLEAAAPGGDPDAHLQAVGGALMARRTYKPLTSAQRAKAIRAANRQFDAAIALLEAIQESLSADAEPLALRALEDLRLPRNQRNRLASLEGAAERLGEVLSDLDDVLGRLPSMREVR
jgi:hypothetical protein